MKKLLIYLAPLLYSLSVFCQTKQDSTINNKIPAGSTAAPTNKTLNPVLHEMLANRVTNYGSTPVMTTDSLVYANVKVKFGNSAEITVSGHIAIVAPDADPINYRVDFFVVNRDGSTHIITGTPGVAGISPNIDPNNQVLVYWWVVNNTGSGTVTPVTYATLTQARAGVATDLAMNPYTFVTVTQEMIDEALAGIMVGGSGEHIIRYNNANLPQRPTLQFEGQGVSVSDSVNKTKVTIPGYILPKMTASVFGGAKVGQGLVINADSTLSVLATSSSFIYVSPTGSDVTGQRGNSGAPFASIAGAKAVYLTNDVISVNPGVYTSQASLEKSGVLIQYFFSQGADVTFTDYMLNSPNADVIIRGKGTFRASHYLVFNSGVNIDIEFDLMTFSTYFWSRTSNTTRLKGRRIDVTSNQFLAIQITTLGSVEVETINMPTATSIVYVNDNTQLDFYNTHITGVAELDMYDSPAVHTRFNLINFYNCRLELYHITTADGPSTTNSFYGKTTFINTDILTSHDGFYFQKTQAVSEIVFDRATITLTDPTTYHVFNRVSFGFGTQALPVKIRVLSGGLIVNGTSVGDVTNLTAYTTPIFQPADTTSPGATLNTRLGIKLRGAPVLVTNEGTVGQVPKSNGNGTATWGNATTGGGGGGNPDSLASHPAAYYLTRANHTGTQAWSTITSTPTTLSGYGITDGATSPLTTKGDIWGYSTTNARLPVGTNGYALLANSSQATGLIWADLSTLYFPLSGGSITGTGGAGFIGLIPQSSAPSAPASGIRQYANAAGAWSWIGVNGFTRTWSAAGLTGNRTYKLQNADMTLADSAVVAGKEGTISAGTTGQYWQYNKTWANFGTSTRNAYVAQSLSLSNAAIVATDSLSVMAGKTQGQINANAANIATNTTNIATRRGSLGDIYNLTLVAGSSSSYAATAPQTTFTFTSGGLTTSGGNNDALNYEEYSYTTNVAYWTRTIRFTITSNGNGVGLGLNSTNGKIIARIDNNSAGNRGKCFIDTYRVGVTTNRVTSSALSYTNGDVIELSLVRSMMTYRVTARNITTSTGTAPVEVSSEWTDPLTSGSTSSAWAAAKPTIFHYGGNHTITTDRYTVNELVRSKVLVYGNSIAAGAFAGGSDNMFTNVLKASILGDVALVAGGGNQTSNYLTLSTEILSLKPEVVVFTDGINDVINAVSLATTQANILQFISDCQANNIIPVLCEVLPISSAYTPPSGTNAAAQTAIGVLNTWMNGLGYVKVIAQNAGFTSAGSLNVIYDSGDGLHPGATGNRLYAANILTGIAGMVVTNGAASGAVSAAGWTYNNNYNGSTVYTVNNTTAGTGSNAGIRTVTDGGTIGFFNTYSSTNSTTSYPGKTLFANNGNGVMLGAIGASGTLQFLTGGGTVATNNRLTISTTSIDALLPITSTGLISSTLSQNSSGPYFSASNSNTGAGAGARMTLAASTSNISVAAFSSAYSTASTIFSANDAAVYANSTSNFLIANTSTGGLNFGAGGTLAANLGGRMSAAGNWNFTSNTTADPTEKVDITGNLWLKVAGNKLKIKSGTNASAGTAVLVAGTVTVATTALAANSIVIIQRQVDGGTVGASYSVVKTTGTGFVITAKDGSGTTNIADTSTVGWWFLDAN